MLWAHAYIFIRRPSLIFIVISARGGEEDTVEKYLAVVELK